MPRKRKIKITAFFCENSAAKAAEPILGHKRLKAIDVITVPCAGSIETRRILETLESGADKILIVGCPLDNCKYISGKCLDPGIELHDHIIVKLPGI